MNKKILLHYLCFMTEKHFIMKVLYSIALSLVLTVAAFGQTAQEIVTKMDQVMAQHQNDGTEMTFEMKLPIVGTVSTKSYILGKKYRLEMERDGVITTAWSDGATIWTYTPSENKIEIDNAVASAESANSNAEMLTGITSGYDVSISRQTADAWYIKCKKSKTNKDKDDPATMDLVVEKDTYMPMSLSAKVSLVTVTIKNLKFGVTESQVTFNPANYPGVQIIDKR